MDLLDVYDPEFDKVEYDPRKDPKAGCQCWLADKLTFPHEHIGWSIVKWDFGQDMPYDDA